MAHLCKCVICGEQFDRDIIQAVRYSARRYAHQICYPEGELVPFPPKIAPPPTIRQIYKKEIPQKEAMVETQEEKDNRKDLLDYISEHMTNPNYARIQLQINEYKQLYGYSYTGIKKTLMYFYDILGGNDEKGHGGIGIVPYLYQEAYKYYFQIYQAKKFNESKNPKDFLPETFEVHIKPPAPQKQNNKLFSFKALEGE